ncbi:SpoIIE family protein phosphatase [Streptomyces albireticuli]|uniref:SpoIIE family protein phosphatase n=1 Tax=Streptomyces albireticuli TaxID=1940 RepID=UPI00117E5BD2|nr:SpoIIE family protein phosphatase [Streptomyces albireticuli]MCD9143666.1 SpoIIE family protein phosphatase [Streptomyces albireticuli]MCD9161903.1 SpoIIE family protein phosphatase [Streptomyces albireticuli]MCD9191783.1 SpoIIE family protein phosphatase [Streptomyces albireticuli]
MRKVVLSPHPPGGPEDGPHAPRTPRTPRTPHTSCTPQTPRPADGPAPATALIDADGRVQQWSDGARDLTGYPEREIVGRDAALLADGGHVQGGDLVKELLRTAGEARGDWVRRRDGTCRSVVWYPVAVPLADGTGVLAVALPQEQRQGDIATLDRLLHSSPVGLAVLDTDLRFRYVNDVLARLNGLTAGEHLGRSVLEVLELPYPEAYEKVLRRVVENGETVDNLQVAGVRPDGGSRVATGSMFPLRDADGTVVGVGGLVHERADAERELLEAARDRRRLVLLGRVGARLGQGLDPRTVAGQLAEGCVPEFADAVEVDLLKAAAEPDVGACEIRGWYATPDSPCTAIPLVHPLVLPPDARRPRPEDDLPPARPASAAVAECVASARPVTFGTEVADGVVRHGLVVPLTAVGRVLGAVTFLRHGAAGYAGDGRMLAVELAARAATAIDNALLYRRERLATLALQRHLLPTRLPSESWFRAAYRYRPAEDGTLAGGDWYDAVALPAGRVGLGVGDVMGHGVGAAAAMGRYRASVHALLAVGLRPGQLLTRLDGILAGDDELAATCVCAVYDAGTGRCRIALAGHPPPLLVRPDGSTGPVPCDPGPPMGMGLHHMYADTEISVEPGSLLVLYTDGMVEDRKGVLDLEQGIAILGKAVRDPRAPLDEICDALMSVRPADSPDDAALLVSRLGRF